jgi:enoyl-CoA hydratase/carnithine racemase
MTTYKCLLCDVKDGIATLTLNRPERLNAIEIGCHQRFCGQSARRERRVHIVPSTD